VTASQVALAAIITCKQKLTFKYEYFRIFPLTDSAYISQLYAAFICVFRIRWSPVLFSFTHPDLSIIFHGTGPNLFYFCGRIAKKKPRKKYSPLRIPYRHKKFWMRKMCSQATSRPT
jgi:hypothetical protein